MRSSRTVSQIDKIDKSVYPKCNLKKEHQKQSLNLVCLTKSCKFHGPICTLCKKEHLNHNIVPIKTFIQFIANSQKKNNAVLNKIQEKQIIQQKPLKNALQRLQQTFHQVMGMLKFQVLQLTEQIKRSQQKILQDFQKVKQSLSEESNKGSIIQQCLFFFNNKAFEDGLQYRQNINKILKLATFGKSKTLIDSDDMQIKSQESQILKQYEEKAEVYKQNLFLIQNQVKQMYEFLSDKSMIQKIQKETDLIRPKTAMPGTVKSQHMSFSPTLKAANIILQKDGKIAKLKDNIGNKIVFFNNGVSSKTLQATIKILSMSALIGIGVAHKDKIKQKSYKFQKNVAGHGAYMIMANMYKYNSVQKAEDGATNSFKFAVGDQIQMSLKLKQKKLTFNLKSDPLKTSVLNFKSLPDAALKDIQFCVLFEALGDKIQIL